MKSHQILAYHILSCVDRIEQYTQGLTEEQFLQNFLVQDGVMRNIEIIAEASKKISDEIKVQYPDVHGAKLVPCETKSFTSTLVLTSGYLECSES
jgi:uncharacterized protein with HEPN domain